MRCRGEKCLMAWSCPYLQPLVAASISLRGPADRRQPKVRARFPHLPSNILLDTIALLPPQAAASSPRLSRQHHTMFGTWRFDCSSEKETLTQQLVDPTTPRPHIMRACQSCREKKVRISPQNHNRSVGGLQSLYRFGALATRAAAPGARRSRNPVYIRDGERASGRQGRGTRVPQRIPPCPTPTKTGFSKDEQQSPRETNLSVQTHSAPTQRFPRPTLPALRT